jgi:hypothetical protein
MAQEADPAEPVLANGITPRVGFYLNSISN